MSDELRDRLNSRARAVDVPTHALADVISGGRRIKWRNRALSTIAAAAVVALVWTGIPALTNTSDHRTPPISRTPTPKPTATEGITDECQTVPFRPTYLPEGWSYVLQPGEGGQTDLPVTQQSPRALGYYAGPKDDKGRPTTGFIDVYRYGDYYMLAKDAPTIELAIGSEGSIGRVEDGFSVEFRYGDCRYSVMAFGIHFRELRRVAKGLRQADNCPQAVLGRKLNVKDGRHFGHIVSINSTDVTFDPAEFLTGEAANKAARKDGAIGPNETVPNDYYIVDKNHRAGTIRISMDVEVFIDTLRDGIPGPAPAEINFLSCAFSSGDPIDANHVSNGYWLTVKGGLVTKIEEQYVP